MLTWADPLLGQAVQAMPAKACQIVLGQALWMCCSQSPGAVWPWQACSSNPVAKPRVAARVSVTSLLCSVEMDA